MDITVNGEKRSLDGPVTVAGLLRSLGFDLLTVVVERNLLICPRETFEEEGLEEGDVIEIVRLVAGG